jgi:hypothetical protein
MSMPSAVPGPILACELLRELLDQWIAASPAATTAEIAPCSVRRQIRRPRREGVGGEFEIGVGSTTAWFLASSAWTLAVGSGGGVDVFGHRSRPDKDGLDVRMRQDGVHAALSPWTTLNTPSGTSLEELGDAHDRWISDGKGRTWSRASAIGNIHIGTMAGKLNGVIPAQTPSG